jgi:large-conductance mechanosensitive channel
MNRRKTVSVTPAMGASTVAGEMVTLPIVSELGTTRVARAQLSPLAGALTSPELSQNLRIVNDFIAFSGQTKCVKMAPLMEPLDESPRQFLDGLKLTIFRRRIGQIALAVVLAEACIRYLSALVWYLIIPLIANLLENHSESVIFASRRSFPLEQLAGSTIEFATVLVFVYFVNRWIYNLSRPRRAELLTDDEAALPTDEVDGDASLNKTPGESGVAP